MAHLAPEDQTSLKTFSSFRNSHPEVFCKKVFVEISQNSQEKTSIPEPFF